MFGFVLFILAVRISSANAAPWACPIFPIEEYGEDEYLYYAEYYETGCGDSPEPTLIVGNYDWPAECPNCEIASRAQASNRKFDGYIGRPKSTDYVFQFPKGPAKRFSEQIGASKYVEFVAEKRVVRAKVFEFLIDIGKALGEQSRKRQIFIGFEADTPSDAQVVQVDAKEIDGTNAHAFTVELESKSVIILTAKQPPIPQAGSTLISRR